MWHKYAEMAFFLSHCVPGTGRLQAHRCNSTIFIYFYVTVIFGVIIIFRLVFIFSFIIIIVVTIIVVIIVIVMTTIINIIIIVIIMTIISSYFFHVWTILSISAGGERVFLAHIILAICYNSLLSRLCAPLGNALFLA